MKTKIRVAVVFGGRSGEHEVSIISGQNIINGLNKKKYDVMNLSFHGSALFVVCQGFLYFDAIRRQQRFEPGQGFRHLLENITSGSIPMASSVKVCAG